MMLVTQKRLRINKNVIKKNEDLNQYNKKIERKILFVLYEKIFYVIDLIFSFVETETSIISEEQYE